MAFTVASLGRQQYQGEMTSAHIRPAGVASNIQESAADALRWGERPPTPPEQKKYRLLNVHEPGKIARHYGAADDPIPEGPFGARKDKTVDSAANVLKGGYPVTEMGAWALEQAEDVYASTKREPLGRGYQRGTSIPEGLGTQRPFGMTIDAKGKDQARQALNIIFPTDQDPNAEEEGTKAHDMYVKSHTAYLPGEQRRRGYNWEGAGVDPAQHRFGAVDKDNYRDGVRKALQPDMEPANQRPVVESSVHADFKLTHRDELGTVRKLGGGDRQAPPNQTFGMPSVRGGGRGPSVGDLLRTPEEQLQPDADLGKSLREGWRNIAPEGRVFGVPSVRTDIPAPTKKSVTCMSNYGNEPDARQLLRPPLSVDRGVNEEHYMKLRSRSDVRSILEEAGITLEDQEFDSVFSMSCQADGEAERCCLDTFFRARHHVLGQTMQLRG